MSEWLSQAFSGGVSLARVNPLGIVLMLAAVILSVLPVPFPNAAATMNAGTG